LNTYGSMDEYAEAKAQIFRHQSSDDVVVLNADDAYGREWMNEAPGKVMTFSRKDARASKFQSKYLLGEHNQMNILAAVLTAKAAGATDAGIKKALASFKGLKNRQEIVATKKGVTYMNDTTATTPDGTIAALDVLKDRYKTIRLIIGGADKELEFDELAKKIKQTKADIVLLPGTAHAKLTTSLKKAGVKFQEVKDLKEAVHALRSRAEKGDIVVLSPACASFGLFANEFERGQQFRKLTR
jgi:UDP-N-acetylmuramoylalanine--D-glutamate ligase